jgi:hypothetical protein
MTLIDATLILELVSATIRAVEWIKENGIVFLCNSFGKSSRFFHIIVNHGKIDIELAHHGMAFPAWLRILFPGTHMVIVEQHRPRICRPREHLVIRLNVALRVSLFTEVITMSAGTLSNPTYRSSVMLPRNIVVLKSIMLFS